MMSHNTGGFDDTSNDDDYGDGSSLGSEIVSERSSGSFSNETCTYEESETETLRRLKTLYPFVSSSLIPRYWNSEDHSEVIQLSHHNMHVSHRGMKSSQSLQSDKTTAALVRANACIPMLCGVYYYEITITHGKDGRVGVGFGTKSMGLTRMPGWDPHSYAYHGDDGHFFTSDGNGREYGPKFKENDTIGAGINLVDQTVFFTLNGKNLGIASHVPCLNELLPALGLQNTDESVETNFGQRPFLYNIEKDIAEARQSVANEIENIALPAEKGTWMNRAICSWLLSEGHVRALSALTRLGNVHIDFSEEAILRRNTIRSLIISKRASEAADRIEQHYPQLFSKNRKIELLLKSQIFVEKSQAIVMESKGSSNSLNVMNGSNSTAGGHQNQRPRGQKRRQRDTEAGTSREEPPARRSPGSNTNEGENAHNGCLKNGNFKNGGEKNGNSATASIMGTTTIEEEDADDEAMDGMLRPDEETTSVTSNRCGYSIVDKAEADNKLGEIIVYGQYVSKLRAQCEGILNGDEKALINDALMAILTDVNDFSKLAHMQKKHREKLSADVNAAIMEYEGYKSISLLDETYTTIMKLKRNLIRSQHPKSPFINVENLFTTDFALPNHDVVHDEAQMDIEHK